MTETGSYNPKKKPSNIVEALQRADYKDKTTKGLTTNVLEQNSAVPVIGRHETPFANRLKKKTGTT